MRTLSSTIAFVFTVFALAGCASTDNTVNTQSQDTISEMEEVSQRLGQLSNRLQQTENLLGKISQSSGSELKEAYSSFESNLSTINDMQSNFSENLEELRSTSNQYLRDWEREAEDYNSAELRRGSEERRQELNQTFSDVMDAGGDVNRSLNSFISDMREIRSYLSNDLTASGVEAIGISQQNQQTGEEVRDAIDRMEQTLSEARQNLGARQQQQQQEQ